MLYIDQMFILSANQNQAKAAKYKAGSGDLSEAVPNYDMTACRYDP